MSNNQYENKTLGFSDLLHNPITQGAIEYAVEQTVETVWGITTDADGVITGFRHHSPLDHDGCCYLPQGCAGGCEQPGGCMEE